MRWRLPDEPNCALTCRANVQSRAMTGPEPSELSSHSRWTGFADITDKEAVRSISAFRITASGLVRFSDTDSQVLSSRLALLSRIFAVDDALLYSSVRRAIEDRYPRYKHHAGLSPLLESLADITPGGGMAKALGRWVLGRLLRPRTER